MAELIRLKGVEIYAVEGNVAEIIIVLHGYIEYLTFLELQILITDEVLHSSI